MTLAPNRGTQPEGRFMVIHTTLAGAVLLLAALAAGACADDPAGLSGADSDAIAGKYRLVDVDGQELPCCAESDSAGGTVSFLGGTLTLARAAPEAYVAAPSGVAVPSRCVHTIPDGATVDTANVVHVPDGSSYTLPRCGDAPYSMALTRRYAGADGTTRMLADSVTGLYVWGHAFSGSDGLVTLVDSGMGGTLSVSATGVEIRVAREHVGPPNLRPPEHVFHFSRIQK